MPDNSQDNRTKSDKSKLLGYVIAACVVIIFYFLLRNGRSVTAAISNINSVLQPIFIGLVMAFLMNPIMEFFEKRLARFFERIFKNQETSKKINRTISTVLALLVMVGVVIFLIATVIPNLISTILYLAEHIEEQIAGVLDWCNEITGGRYEASLMKAKDNKIGDLIQQGLDFVNKNLDLDESDMVSTITNSVISIGKTIINIIVGMFVSVYVLISKETFKGQAKKLICGLFKANQANIILEISRKTADIFYGFIIGKIIDSIVIGVICYISCLIMDMPYPILVSVIVGITNIIPVFGPYIGAVPTVIIIFLTEPMKGIYFLIFIIILQQIDGNLIGPKILGDSTGISSFWVVFAVVVGAGLSGIGGMVIAVPCVAVIYYIVGRISGYLVKKRGLPEATSEYINLDYIDADDNKLVKHIAEPKPKKKFIKQARFGKKK